MAVKIVIVYMIVGAYRYKDIRLNVIYLRRNKMKREKEIQVVFGILFIFGTVLIVATGTLNTLNAQTNSTINQTSTFTKTPAKTTSAQTEASESIKGAITETGKFVSNVTEKIVTSKTAGTFLNETSEVLGDAYVEAKRFFSPN
jgi:hypothetical protein